MTDPRDYDRGFDPKDAPAAGAPPPPPPPTAPPPSASSLPPPPFAPAPYHQPPHTGAEPPPIPPEAFGLPAVAPIDAACRRCGYVVGSLSTRGDCPECGLPILHSLLGNLLRYTEPTYVRRMYTGARIVLVSYILSVLGGLAGIAIMIMIAVTAANPAGAPPPTGLPGQFFRPNFGMGGAGELLTQVAAFAASALGLFGWWLLTERDPAQTGADPTSRHRGALRVMLVLTFLGAAGTLVLSLIPGVQQALGAVTTPAGGGTPGISVAMVVVGVLGLALSINKIVQAVLEMLYLRDVAKRVPDMSLAAFANTMTWVNLGLETVGCLLCGFGPLIAFTIKAIVVFRIMFRLRGVAAQAKAEELRRARSAT